MAILALPALIRPRFAITTAPTAKSAPVESIVPQKIDTRRFIFVMASVVTLNLLVIAGVNILITQDAFTLQRLKAERNFALDKKDATLSQVNLMNSPASVARLAQEMGMVPAVKINYLTYSELSEIVKVGK